MISFYTLFVIFSLAVVLAGSLPLPADELDDLLNERRTSTKLDENGRFLENWEQFLEALAKREFDKAEEVMETLETSRSYISPRRRDFIRLAGTVLRFEQSLETEKEAFREEYRKAVEDVAEVERAIKRLELEISARQRKNTKSNQLPPAVKAIFDKRRKDLSSLLLERRKFKESMDAEARNFEAARLSKLSAEISRWISKEDSEEDVVTGLVLSSAYLNLVGDDAKIRAQSQDLSTKQEELEMAAKIYNAIAVKIEPLIESGKGEEAKTELRTMIAKVETSERSPFVKQVAVEKLKALSITVDSAMKTERNRQAISADEMAQISARLVFLERKLAAAQSNFGTLIRSLDGFADYTGDFEDESDLKKTGAKLKEEVKFGVVSKEKLDNMVRAKAEHVGIMREVEILQTEASKLSTLQKAQLANLSATAHTALQILKEVTP